MSPRCNSTVLFALAIVCVPLGMALTGSRLPGDAIGVAIGADGMIQQTPNGEKSGSSFVEKSRWNDQTDIMFGGSANHADATMDGTTIHLLRPGSVKSEVCDGDACKGCTNYRACWHGQDFAHAGMLVPGDFLRDGVLELVRAKRGHKSYVAEVYLRCPTGGAATIDMKKLHRGTYEIYTDHEKSGQMKRMFERSGKKGKHILAAKDLEKDTRIRVVFYPRTASKSSSARVEIRAGNVDPHVDMCMTATECLALLGDGDDPEASFKLRNKNKFQLKCLQGKPMPSSLQKKCKVWNNCVSKSDAHKKNLVALLRAGVGVNGGSLNQGAAAVNDTAATAIDPNQCIDPAADDAESWDCECLEDMVSDCKGSDSPLEECLKASMCNFAAVCDHWKTDNSCPSALIQEKSSDASAQLMPRMMSDNDRIVSRAEAGENKMAQDKIDDTLKGKCTTETRL